MSTCVHHPQSLQGCYQLCSGAPSTILTLSLCSLSSSSVSLFHFLLLIDVFSSFLNVFSPRSHQIGIWTQLCPVVGLLWRQQEHTVPSMWGSLAILPQRPPLQPPSSVLATQNMSLTTLSVSNPVSCVKNHKF